MSLTSRFKAFFAGSKPSSLRGQVALYKVRRIAEEWAQGTGIAPVDVVCRPPTGLFVGKDVGRVEIAALGTGFPHRKALADEISKHGYLTRHEGKAIVVSEK